MKLASYRQAMSALPQANSQQTSWVMLEDNERIVHTETFDNNLFMLILHEWGPTEIDKRFFGDEPGQFNLDLAPEWLEWDESSAAIDALEGESQTQAFIRQWDAWSAS